MSELPLPAKLYAAVLTALSIGLTVVLLVVPDSGDGLSLFGALAVSACIAFAWLRPFPLSFKRKLFLDTSVLTLAILLFPAGMAMAIAGIGTLAAYATRRKDWTEGVFNSAQMVAQAAAGSAVLAIGNYDRSLNDLNKPLTLVWMLIAGAVMFLVNNGAVALMVSLQSGMSPQTVVSRIIKSIDRVEIAGYLAQVGLGVAGAIVVLAAPWMIPLLIFPLAAAYLMIERNLTFRWQAELSLKERDIDLAEAQRIAQLGSWRWDLVSGIQAWSPQTFRILDVSRDEHSPSYETFISRIHPADRTAVDTAIHEALYAEATFSLEHRLSLKDGTERIVHQRGEVILDEQGNKTTIVGTIQDITERKNLEEQLKQFAERDRIEAERAEGRRRLAASRELERVRLARELHDGPVQDLLAISYTLAPDHPGENEEPNGVVRSTDSEQIRGDVLGVVAELRSLVGELRPPGLAEFGLTAALEGYVAELSRRQGPGAPEIIVDLDGAVVGLPETTAISVFRIAQEGIRNALRHADASEVKVGISRLDGNLRLEISDDGRGFNVPTRMNDLAEQGHFGLIGLVERVDQANGELEFKSESGSGTTITVMMPVTGQEEQIDEDDQRRFGRRPSTNAIGIA
jgi:signal transduction histidine kinase